MQRVTVPSCDILMCIRHACKLSQHHLVYLRHMDQAHAYIGERSGARRCCWVIQKHLPDHSFDTAPEPRLCYGLPCHVLPRRSQFAIAMLWHVSTLNLFGRLSTHAAIVYAFLHTFRSTDTQSGHARSVRARSSCQLAISWN